MIGFESLYGSLIFVYVSHFTSWTSFSEEQSEPSRIFFYVQLGSEYASGSGVLILNLLNSFHTSFRCLRCWLWTSTYRLVFLLEELDQIKYISFNSQKLHEIWVSLATKLPVVKKILKVKIWKSSKLTHFQSMFYFYTP